MITWEELQKMNVPSIRTRIAGKPQKKELSGAKFNIESLFGKEIYVIDWLFLEKSPINQDREMIKLQFYYNGILGVVYTTADDIISSIKGWQESFGGEIKPFKDTIIKDGMSYKFQGLNIPQNQTGVTSDVRIPECFKSTVSK